MKQLKAQVTEVITNSNLDYNQKKHYLAALAESTQEYPSISNQAQEAFETKVIDDLFEGNAPYRPRYILPDYAKALKKGCKYLELEAPKDLDEAINFLSILYLHVPSITGYTVYLGNIDQLLLPYIKDVSEEDLYKKLKLFWRYIDRSLPDAFVHMNIGPEDNIVARTILKIDRELKQVVPNISLKYDEDITSDSLLEEAIKTVYITAKPHIANHKIVSKEFGEQYGIVSCYNSLKQGGGSHTLVRLNLRKVAELHKGSTQEFLDNTLTKYTELTLEIIEARTKFLVEEVKFFESSFLAQEGFIDLKKFSAMFGFFGLAEAVNLLIEREHKLASYGHSQIATELGYAILKKMKEVVEKTELSYCEGNQSKAFFHAQSGIDIDIEETAGARIPIGQEPDIYTHINAVAPNHQLCDGGISDIFHFDQTAKQNPQAIADIIKASFEKGMRMFTFNIADSEFIRITGYLVRRSDLELFKEEGSRYSSAVFASNSMYIQSVDERTNKRVGNLETSFKL